MALEPFDFSAHLPTYTPPINLAWEAAKMGFANEMHDRLLEQIADFEKSLKPDEEIGAYLAAFGQGLVHECVNGSLPAKFVSARIERGKVNAFIHHDFPPGVGRH